MKIIWILTFISLGWMSNQLYHAPSPPVPQSIALNQGDLLEKALNNITGIADKNETKNGDIGSNTFSWILQKSEDNLKNARIKFKNKDLTKENQEENSYSETKEYVKKNTIHPTYELAYALEKKSHHNNTQMKEALELYQQAAESGDGRAQSRLGIAYLKGEMGLKINAQQAEKWLTEAAIQDELDAQYYLGKLLLKDKDTEIIDALVWVAVAAKRGYEPAQKMVKDNWSKLSSNEKDELLSRVRQWKIHTHPQNIA